MSEPRPGGAGVVIRDLTHVFGGVSPVEVLAGVDLDVGPGDFVTLLGPSGCGKSTLLRILAGLLAPSSGTAELDGRSLVGQPGLVAYMPQRDLLLPWRRAMGNAILGAEVDGVPRAEAVRWAKPLFARFGLRGFERAWPSELSGGMRQRLALLRTFLLRRAVLLLDEPFGALDAITRRTMYEWLGELWSTDHRTVVFVTHDIDEAVYLSDRVVVLSERPGRVRADVRVDLPRPRRPELLTSGGFIEFRAHLLDLLAH